MTWLTFILSLIGFGCFGFATDDHHHRLTGRRPASVVKTRWRAAAWVALAFAFASAVGAHGWAFGPVWWFGAVMLAACVVFLALNLWPPRFRGNRH